MRNVIVGTLSGVSAVIVLGLLSPRPQVVPAPVVREMPAQYYRANEDHGQRFMPTTQPDPAREKLNKVLENVSFKDQRLDKVLAYLAATTGANFSVNWRSLEEAGIKADRPVTVEVKRALARNVLMAALDDATLKNPKLTYRIFDGVIRISTEDDFSRYHVTRIYNVRDLIDQTCLHSRKLSKDGATGLTENEATDQLVNLVEETIDPTAWRTAGGTSGLRGFNGLLIVTTSEENQDSIVDFLTALRQRQK